jgi:secreted trypsin-like serine protease
MISLQFYDSWFREYYHVCGAALIDATHVVTAAHCVDER